MFSSLSSNNPNLEDVNGIRERDSVTGRNCTDLVLLDRTNSTNPQIGNSVLDSTESSIFTASLSDVTMMSQVLKEINHVNDNSVFVINKQGVRIVTSGEPSFQVSVLFEKAMFESYVYNSDQDTEFGFLLKHYIQCLNLLCDDPFSSEAGTDTNDISTARYPISLYMQYRNKGGPKKLKLELGQYTARIDLKSFEAEVLPLGYGEGEEANMGSITFYSSKFYELINSLDFSSTFIEISLENSGTPLKMTTKSELGEVEVLIVDNPQQESIIVPNSNKCPPSSTFCFRYRTSFMKPAIQALTTSSQVTLKCDSYGLLCLEHIKNISSTTPSQNQGTNNIPKKCSVEYYMMSEAPELDLY